MDEGRFEALVERAREGDQDARSAVLQRLEPVLRSFFVRRIGRIDDVDDLVQNALVRILRGFDDLKEARSMRAFALKAALFELQDWYRGRYQAREGRIDAATPEPAAAAPPVGMTIDLDRALAQLTPRARSILELKAMGYRYEEIASMIDSTEAAVKMQVKRALERLRHLLGPSLWLLTAAGEHLSAMLLFEPGVRL